MSKQPSEYVIAGGAEGKKRLNTLAEALYPYTSSLLQSLGVGEGASFLDNGCGGGNVTLMVAEMTGPGGQVTGLDLDEEILLLAEADARQKGLDNVRFINKTVHDLAEVQAYDFTYARFLLSHLGDPLQALMRMKEATKAGGMVIAEDIHFSGHFSYPVEPSFRRYLELYGEVVRKRGGDAEIGPRLPELFKQAGIHNTGFDVVQPCFNTGDGKWMAWITLDKIKDAVINEGITTGEALQKTLTELDAFTRDPRTIISLPRIFRVWGRV